jgi:hypothetical protein
MEFKAIHLRGGQWVIDPGKFAPFICRGMVRLHAITPTSTSNLIQFELKSTPIFNNPFVLEKSKNTGTEKRCPPSFPLWAKWFESLWKKECTLWLCDSVTLWLFHSVFNKPSIISLARNGIGPKKIGFIWAKQCVHKIFWSDEGYMGQCCGPNNATFSKYLNFSCLTCYGAKIWNLTLNFKNNFFNKLVPGWARGHKANTN